VTVKKVSLALQGEMFLRSFCVQASWNFEKLQNLGFAFLIRPAVTGRKKGMTDEDWGAVKKHMGYFNTHPYFAGLVAAAVAAEEGGALDDGRFLDDLKRSLMSTLGSIGDNFFWASLRPLAALLAVLPALFGWIWAPLVFLVLFNGPHLYVRWWGIGSGLRYGCNVIRLIEKLPFARLVPLLSILTAAAAGAAAGAAALHPGWRPLEGSALPSALMALLIFLAAMKVTQSRMAKP